MITFRRCEVADCKSPSTRKSMCNKHYRRFMKYGDAMKLKNREAGQGTPHNSGYWMFEENGRSVLRHIKIAEKALGRRLPKGAQVHHVDGDRGNDANQNLVICQDRFYHQLLHKRQRALNACGNPDWIKCHICKKYDDPSKVRTYQPSGLHRHIQCWREQYQAQKR